MLYDIENSSKLANNTYEKTLVNGTVIVELHGHPIVTRDTIDQTYGQWTLDSCGYLTGVTKDRLNKFSPATVVQRQKLWYIEYNGELYPFYDGIKVDDFGEPIPLPESTLVRNQKKTETFMLPEGKLRVELRYDDECRNGHNSFSITGDFYERCDSGKVSRRLTECGCIHDRIAKTKYKPYIKWHLMSSDEPMHYIANTMHHYRDGDYEAAKECGLLYDIDVDEIKQMNEKQMLRLLDHRLPRIRYEFKNAMESLGFEW